MKKEALIDLLRAEWSRASSLLSMHTCIQDGQFQEAMQYQFSYLYWTDEWYRLYKLFARERFNLQGKAGGL